MTIGFIGAGKVGQSLGLLFKEQGYSISGYYSRHGDALVLDQRLSQVDIYTELDKLVGISEVIGITVPDDQIDRVVSELETQGIDFSEKFFFHSSGAHTVESLKKLSNRVFSIHPLMAFPNVVSDLRSFDNIYFGIENLDVFIESGLNLKITNYFGIQSELKSKYHAGAAIISNYLVAVIDFGLSQFMELGLDADEAQKAIWPLVSNTLDNINILGTKKALTGPIVRGDVGTIEAHLNALSKDLVPLYRALGQYTLQMTNHQKLVHKKLEKLLEEDDYDKDHNINF